MPETSPGLTRRSFLTTTAAAAGAALLAQPARASRTGSPVRLACIGLGRRGMGLARLCAGLPYVKIAAVYDAHRVRCQNAASRFGARACMSCDEALDHADAAVIAAPDHLHGRYTLAALRAGKHVYLEPPLSLELSEARQIAALAQREGLAIQVGITACSDPRWERLRVLASAGELGKIRMAQYHAPQSTRGLRGGTQPVPDVQEVDWAAFDSTSSFAAQRITHWRSYPNYCLGPAAALHLEGLVLLSKTLDLAGVKRISAVGGVFAHQHQSTFDSLMSTVDLEDGCSLCVTASPTAPNQPPILRGSRGSARLLGEQILFSRETGETEQVAATPAAPSAHLENWLHAVRGDAACTCPPGLVLHAQEMLHTALRAAQTGAAVYV